VAGLWDTQVMQFAAKNSLEPLDQEARQHGLTRGRFKPVFYDGCLSHGHLYALPSTVWSVALIWNKQLFMDRADALRRAGCDPNRAPRTLAELDCYAAALDTWETRNGRRHLTHTGFIPLESGSFANLFVYWFGGNIVDPSGTRLLFTSPQMIDTYNWVRSYSRRLGKDSLTEFRSGFGGFDSPQNPFLVDQNAMEMQGPWIAAFIEKLKPSMNRWHVPPDQLARERNFPRVVPGMTLEQVEQILGSPTAGQSPNGPMHWAGGIVDLTVSFSGGRVSAKESRLLPAVQRRQYCQWGAAPFPSAAPGANDVTYAGMDVLVIPRGSKHKREAFEFISFVERQDQIERLSSLHCNLSPLREESEQYSRDHPNPYVGVYETLASSPNARSLPPLPNWPQVFDELTQVGERSYLQQATTQDILADAQQRTQKQLDDLLGVAQKTDGFDQTAVAGAAAHDQ
jgi:ABC-type glycerol-3-phosphate transport system substrate-binding protein